MKIFGTNKTINIMLKQISFLLALFVSFQTFAQDTQTEARALYNKAEDLLNDGNSTEALKKIINVEKLLGSPNSKTLYLKVKIFNNLAQVNWVFVDSTISAIKIFFDKTDKNSFPSEKYFDIANISIDIKDKKQLYEDKFNELSIPNQIDYSSTFASLKPNSAPTKKNIDRDAYIKTYSGSEHAKELQKIINHEIEQQESKLTKENIVTFLKQVYVEGQQIHSSSSPGFGIGDIILNGCTLYLCTFYYSGNTKKESVCEYGIIAIDLSKSVIKKKIYNDGSAYGYYSSDENGITFKWHTENNSIGYDNNTALELINKKKNWFPWKQNQGICPIHSPFLDNSVEKKYFITTNNMWYLSNSIYNKYSYDRVVKAHLFLLNSCNRGKGQIINVNN